jgi:N,N'-diacetyllegionaminate synthase
METAFGSGIKRPTSCEYDMRYIARKSLIAKRNIRKGEIFTAENITAKRPGTGISPSEWDKIIGRKTIRNFKEDDLIEI